MRTHRTTCKVGACEPFCGLEVDVEAGKMVAVRPDPAHPITKGYSCIKGMRVLDYQNDPDRLTHPIRRSATGWERIAWATASRVDAERLGVEDGTTVRVVSRTGTLEIRAVVSDEIREGVVMIHQFWGHKVESGMRTSRSHPGENVNFLHDDCVRDSFTGMPVFNGTPCRVEAI